MSAAAHRVEVPGDQDMQAADAAAPEPSASDDAASAVADAGPPSRRDAVVRILIVVGGLLFIGLGGGLILVVRSEALARRLGRFAERIVAAVLKRLGRSVPDIEGALVRFRVTLGDTIRAQGLAAFVVAMVSKLAWSLLMVVAMRVLGVPEQDLPPSVIVTVVALAFVITVLPISPGGAGVPDLLYITFLTTYTSGAYANEISAAVILFRAFQWFLPIPFAWGLLARSRRGKSLLPTPAEFRAADAATGAA
jgi:uncharacterized membrane protein YbhN (UPF0104 family)